MDVGESLKRIRKSSGYNAKDFAKLLGISYSTYSNYENGNREPKIDTLKKISKALKVTIDSIANNKLDETELGVKENLLLDYFMQLNDNGKNKLLEHAELLEKVEEYRKN